jgi:hypothetical protein
MPKGYYVRKLRPMEDRFWEKVIKDGPTMDHMTTPCWRFRGGHDGKGYPRISIGTMADGHTHASHAAWKIHYGQWPTLCVLHRCDNPGCVRWDHLFEGTKGDNNRDTVAKGRHRTNAPRGVDHRLAKLTEDQVREIRIARKVGDTLKGIGERFGVTGMTVHYVCGKGWRHVSAR